MYIKCAWDRRAHFRQHMTSSRLPIDSGRWLVHAWEFLEKLLMGLGKPTWGIYQYGEWSHSLYICICVVTDSPAQSVLYLLPLRAMQFLVSEDYRSEGRGFSAALPSPAPLSHSLCLCFSSGTWGFEFKAVKARKLVLGGPCMTLLGRGAA